MAIKGLTAIANEPDVYRTLVEWTGYVESLGNLLDQQESARKLLILIDQEIEKRG